MTERDKKPSMKSAPFKVGDRVRTSWPNMSRDRAAWWVTRVVSIGRVTYSEAATGWLIVGAATDPCSSCGLIAHAETPPLGADWFKAAHCVADGSVPEARKELPSKKAPRKTR